MGIRPLLGVFLMLVVMTVGNAEDRIVIMVGVDGFRWDYLQKFHPPVLSRLAAQGVTAERMTPSFPTLTFPNFYTLATGLRPENHGIIGNNMFDPEFNAKFSLGSPSVQESRWWGGEPIWVTAEKQGLRAACMFWPGSEAEIGGVRPTDFRVYQQDLSPEARVQTVLEWLARPAGQRPRLITLYFHEADTAGHKFGPDSAEVAEAVAKVDAAIGQLVDGVENLKLGLLVNFVIVADHGMTEVSPDRVIALDSMIDLKSVQIDFTNALAGLRPLQGTVDDLFAKLSASPQHYKVYRREEMPDRLHFRNNRRIPPIIMVPDEGWLIVREPPRTKAATDMFQRATHGFDPAFLSMGGLFIAEGPAYKHGVVLPPFDNIQIYDLVCATLGLKPAANDGDSSLTDQVLAK